MIDRIKILGFNAICAATFGVGLSWAPSGYAQPTVRVAPRPVYCAHYSYDPPWESPENQYAALIKETDLTLTDINNQWREFIKSKGIPGTGSTCVDSTQTYNRPLDGYIREQEDIYYKKSQRLDWNPSDNAASSPRRTATVSYSSPDPKKGENGYLRATFKVEYQLIACFGELHIAYSLVDRSVALAGGGYRIGNEVHTKVADPDPALNSVDLEGAVREPTKHLVGRFRDRNTGKALGFGCFPGQTQKIALLKDILGPDAKPERVAAYLEGLYATFSTPDLRKSADVETAVAQEGEARRERIRQGKPENEDYAAEHIIERAEVERERKAAEIAQREKASARSDEARRRDEEFQKREQERLAAYSRQVEEHQKQLAESQRLADEHQKQLAENERQAAAARLQFEQKQAQYEQKQAQYEQERAAWEAATTKLRR